MKYVFLLTAVFICGNLSAAKSGLLPQGKSDAYVQFLIDGKLYEGYLGIDGNNRLRVDISIDSDLVTDDDIRVDAMLSRIEGYLVPGHQDVGLEVYLLGDRDDVGFRHGVVEEVYDNGYQKIGVYSESYHSGDTIHFFKPEYLIIHKATLMKDGGFAILN